MNEKQMVNFLIRTTVEVSSGTDFMFFLQMRALKQRKHLYIKKKKKRKKKMCGLTTINCSVPLNVNFKVSMTH